MSTTEQPDSSTDKPTPTGASSVLVRHLNPHTTDADLHRFFSFCGPIKAVHRSSEKGSSEKGAEGSEEATVEFERPSSAKTALLLHGAQLNAVEELSSPTTEHTPPSTEDPAHAHDTLDHPATSKVAHILANGYVLSDTIIQNAITFDQKHGISPRFVERLQSLDAQVGDRVVGPNQTISAKATATAQKIAKQVQDVDQQRGYSTKAYDLFSSYYTKAIATPAGQTVKSFYTTVNKQVLDVHQEAKRIAEQKKSPTAPHSPETSAAPVTSQGHTVSSEKEKTTAAL